MQKPLNPKAFRNAGTWVKPKSLQKCRYLGRKETDKNVNIKPEF